MLTLFFSGTGNTKYVAEKMSGKMRSVCHSIEDDINFTPIMYEHDRICICYPIYGSRVPPIFTEFTNKYKESFANKKIIIIVTQYLFSGDGARSFTDLFPENYFDVIYAEHIDMPNNISNFPMFPIKNGTENKVRLQKADAKIDRICNDLAQNKTVKRGFGAFSRLLGLSQGAFAKKMMARGRRSVVVDGDCICCGACVKACPMKNLELVNNRIEAKNNCTVCYRCVNLCPEMAITTLLDTKPKTRYHGIT